MKNTHFYCQGCHFVGPVSAFREKSDEIEEEIDLCPKCGEQDVFPMRLYRCVECGTQGSDLECFGDGLESFIDPIAPNSSWTFICPAFWGAAPHCQSTRCKQIPIPKGLKKYAHKRSITQWDVDRILKERQEEKDREELRAQREAEDEAERAQERASSLSNKPKRKVRKKARKKKSRKT